MRWRGFIINFLGRISTFWTIIIPWRFVIRNISGDSSGPPESESRGGPKKGFTYHDDDDEDDDGDDNGNDDDV
jgi:hypothetical protein